MSIRHKVNVVNSVQYPLSLRRFIAEGKDETIAGILSSGSYAWIANGDKLSIVDTSKGVQRSTYSFGEDSKDPVQITCIEELVLDRTSRTPLLLVGTSSLRNSHLCVFNPCHSRIIRAIQIDNLQVRCMAIVEDGGSPINSLTDVLSAMEGVVALGCADGSVVLADLNRQAVVKAYQGHHIYSTCVSKPQPLKFVSTADEDTTIIEITEAQHMGASSAITLIEGDGKDVEFGVTALSFSRETACLYIGYSSGLWQIWNLSFSNPTMMFECAECANPVSSFCQIEPCEDPRPTVYLWVNHEGTESSMPLLNMYTLSYANKQHINDYGVFYQDFIHCSLSFSMYPGEEFPNVTSGRLLSAKAYPKTIKRNLIQNMGLPDMEGIQIKLVATAFTLTYARGSTHSYLCIFDLDQWYKEQMPHESACDASFIETSELCAESLIASCVLSDTISLHDTEEPQEIHLVPQALSFDVIGISENGLMKIEKIGLQKLWLCNTRAIGAKSLIHPTKLFHACVSAGLIPMFPAHQNADTCLPTNEEMRSYIMSVCLDNGLVEMILEVGKQWESGVNASSNCTLNFLFDWVWSSVSTVYKSVNSICDTLFSASSQEFDVSLKRRLQLCRLTIDRLDSIHRAFCAIYGNTHYEGTLETRQKGIEIITLFVHIILWFVNVGLLPEANSKSLPTSAIFYDYQKLDRYAVDRRQRLNNLFMEFSRAGKAHEIPGAGLYIVDHLCYDYNELRQQWEDEGGSTAYPPPSIQSLLRSLRIPTVPSATRLALVQYTLLDIQSIIDKSKHEDVLLKLDTFYLLPKVKCFQTKVIRGIWCLDHSFYEEGLKYLLDRTLTVSDLSEGLHRAILRLLYFEGKENLAIQYLRLRNPPVSLPDDLKLEMSILLANKLTSEAYHFQRQHTYLRETLLRQLFTECLANDELCKLLNFHLDDTEINTLNQILSKYRNSRYDDLRVAILISRSRFADAKILHEKLLASSKDRNQVREATREMVIKGLSGSLNSAALEFSLQKNSNLKNYREFKTSKPHPLSVFANSINNGGFPNYGISKQPSALACSANLERFINHKNGGSRFTELLGEEPQICSEESTSLWGKQDSKSVAPGKRAGTWASSSNKRRRIDEGALSEDDVIASFVGTPLVKRRSRELSDPASNNSSARKPTVHSILKSGRTPGTPGRSTIGAQDDMGTPKKTLRWDIPSLQSGKEAVKKSLLSTSFQTPTNESHNTSVSNSLQEAQNPEEIDSIKNRLRSHSPSTTHKSDSAIWSQIAEEAKAKVLFSYSLPPKKTRKSPVGPSFIEQINQLITNEKLRKKTESIETSHLQPLGALPSSDGTKETQDDAVIEEQADLNDQDVEMTEQPNPLPASSNMKRFKFLDITIGEDELCVLNDADSPFPTSEIPAEIKEQLRAKFNQASCGQAERIARPVEDHKLLSEGHDAGASASPEMRTPEKRRPKVLFSDSISVERDEDNESVAEELRSEVLQHKDGGDVKVPPEAEDQTAAGESIEALASTSMKTPLVEQADLKTTSDIASDSAVLKITESNAVSDANKNTSKDNVNAFAVQITPSIGSVVSLSRSNYAEDEDEVGSEDPEEAEIPPIIEFSQPEEGLVIDASYALKDGSKSAEEEEDDDDVNEEKPDDDSGSSVICIESDSDQEPNNRTELDYEGYEEDSQSEDSEEVNDSSRGRRSFFADKWSGEGDKRDSDVDLYDMDEVENDDELPDNDDLDDEIFAMGRGIQESKDLDVNSEEEEQEEEEEEEDEDDDDEIDEEEYEADEIVPTTSKSPTTNRWRQEDDMVEVISSSEEEDVAVVKGVGTSKPDAVPLAQVEHGSSNNSAEDETANHQHHEDQSAVVALLGLTEPTSEESDPTAESNCEIMEPHNVELKKTEMIVSESTSQATDVIDILNLSQGQMFFGSSEGQICAKPPDRALFQLGTSNFIQRSEEDDQKKVDQPKQQVAGLLSLTEETLELRVNESDIVRDNVLANESQRGIPEEGPSQASEHHENAASAISADNDFRAPLESHSDSNNIVGQYERQTVDLHIVTLEQKEVVDSNARGEPTHIPMDVGEEIGVCSTEIPPLKIHRQTEEYDAVVSTIDSTAVSKLLPPPIVDQPQAADVLPSPPMNDQPRADVLSSPPMINQPQAADELSSPPMIDQPQAADALPPPPMNDQPLTDLLPTSPMINQPQAADELSSPPMIDEPQAADELSSPPMINQPQAAEELSSPPMIDQPQAADASPPPPMNDQPLGDVLPTPPMINQPQAADELSSPSMIDKPQAADALPLPPMNNQPQADVLPTSAMINQPQADVLPTPPMINQPQAADELSSPPMIDQPQAADALPLPPMMNQPQAADVLPPLALNKESDITSCQTRSSTKSSDNLPKSNAVCQTTLVESSPPPSSKSFSCQAAMDTTKYGSNSLITDDSITSNVSVNPCDVAFAREPCETPVTATPNTPLRKSLRLARKGTPGRALVADEEVYVSDSTLDVAVLEPEIDDDGPTLVDKSMNTDPKDLTKPIVPSKASLKETKTTRKGREDIDEIKEKISGRDSKRQSSGWDAPPLDTVAAICSKPRPPPIRRSYTQRRASSVESDSQTTSNTVRRHSRSSSVQPETLRGETERRRSGRRSSVEPDVVEKDIPKEKPSSRASSSSRRHSSVEPEVQSKRSDSRRASSEEPIKKSYESRKRQSYAGQHSGEKSPLSSKLRKREEQLDVDDKEYRRRKSKHSITEPLEKKKHQHEEPGLGEPSAKQSRRSELNDDVSTASSSSGRMRRSRSVGDFPVRRSTRPSGLSSIEEIPEDSHTDFSTQPARSKKSMRASAGKLTELDYLMSDTKGIDISKWMNQSCSQVVNRLYGGPSTSAESSKKENVKHLDLGAFWKSMLTPVKEDSGQISPTGSVASITSSASSKILRSGRVVDNSTPTRRTRDSTHKPRVARTLALATESPAKTAQVAGESVTDEDSIGARSESDNISSSTDHHQQDFDMEEIMSSRRLTRRQRSMLESNLSATSRSVEEGLTETPVSTTPKRKSKKH